MVGGQDGGTLLIEVSQSMMDEYLAKGRGIQ
jgi:hypothetical protein